MHVLSHLQDCHLLHEKQSSHPWHHVWICVDPEHHVNRFLAVMSPGCQGLPCELESTWHQILSPRWYPWSYKLKLHALSSCKPNWDLVSDVLHKSSTEMHHQNNWVLDHLNHCQTHRTNASCNHWKHAVESVQNHHAETTVAKWRHLHCCPNHLNPLWTHLCNSSTLLQHLHCSLKTLPVLLQKLSLQKTSLKNGSQCWIEGLGLYDVLKSCWHVTWKNCSNHP